jgi:hypothetical protein
LEKAEGDKNSKEEAPTSEAAESEPSAAAPANKKMYSAESDAESGADTEGDEAA